MRRRPLAFQGGRRSDVRSGHARAMLGAMKPITHHSAQRALAASTRGHARAGHVTTNAMHPQRAAVASHLHHMHTQITSPGMADHPITPSENDMLKSGADAITRAGSSV